MVRVSSLFVLVDCHTIKVKKAKEVGYASRTNLEHQVKTEAVIGFDSRVLECQYTDVILALVFLFDLVSVVAVCKQVGIFPYLLWLRVQI